MSKKGKLKKKINNYFFDHPIQRQIYNYSFSSVASALSGIIFALGFACFITVYDDSTMRLVTGGFSGFTQSIVMIMNRAGVAMSPSTLQSLFYFALNIPAIIFAFFKIGRRFAITTAVNVGLSSLFISVFSSLGVVQNIALSDVIRNSPLTRVLFAGVCTGISSGLALKAGTSCGGMDIVTYYLSLKKSTGVTKYNLVVNCFVIGFYTIINIAYNPESLTLSLLIIPFALVYLLVSSLVVDTIHVRNKKIAIEIITKNDYMSDVLVSIFPHSCTIVEGKGAYSHEGRHIIKMVVSSFESRKVVRTCKKIDPDAFISLTPLQQVYGNFFINPID